MFYPETVFISIYFLNISYIFIFVGLMYVYCYYCVKYYKYFK